MLSLSGKARRERLPHAFRRVRAVFLFWQVAALIQTRSAIWNKTFQLEGILEVENYFRGYPMARLFAGEQRSKLTALWRLLRGHANGLREKEAAEMLGWERRTANNYLRDLKTRGNASKEGRAWHAEE